MSSFSSKAAFLALLSVSQLASGQETCGPSRNSADFVYELIPTVGPTVRWTMDTEAGTISFEVESAEETWTSIGFSPDGMMVGADAVVGLPDDAAVVEYDLLERNFDGVVLFEEQEITDASVSQGGGVTTLRFTRPLTPTVESKQVISSTPGDLTTIIWATGVDNTFGFHGGEEEDRFGFQVDLFCGDEGAAGTLVTTAPTPAPSMMDTLMPLAEGETAAPSSPAPTAADGDRGVGGGDGGVATPAPADAGAGATVTAGPTPAPSAAEDGSGQGDASGASFVAGGSWVAVAAAGAVTALAALSL